MRDLESDKSLKNGIWTDVRKNGKKKMCGGNLTRTTILIMCINEQIKTMYDLPQRRVDPLAAVVGSAPEWLLESGVWFPTLRIPFIMHFDSALDLSRRVVPVTLVGRGW